jgi:hypothetical protein
MTLYHYSIQSNKNITAKSSAVNLLTDYHSVQESCTVSYINNDNRQNYNRHFGRLVVNAYKHVQCTKVTYVSKYILTIQAKNIEKSVTRSQHVKNPKTKGTKKATSCYHHESLSHFPSVMWFVCKIWPIPSNRPQNLDMRKEGLKNYTKLIDIVEGQIFLITAN